MRTLPLAMSLVLGLPGLTSGKSHKPTIRLFVTESSADVQSYDVPARLVCGPFGPTCAARGAQTVNTYTIRIKARTNSGEGMWLSCQLAKKSDEKHCGKLLPGEALAEAKGKDKIIVYAWSNPLYKGDLTKASTLEYQVSPRELDQQELDSEEKRLPIL